MKAKNENFLLWEQQIKERVQSGLTVDEWRNRNDISKHKYNYWNHKLRKNQNQATNKEILLADVTAISQIHIMQERNLPLQIFNSFLIIFV